ncbi:PD-(D/E)XK nuclease family protein [Alicyclobacillus macrosporangiidus]|uniref:ATP-dependent helicase/nuclease subunit B n=1 Tax=Alicyclobacillus macrosporangiidus TaxID=392015 RepID=A0A1I7L3U9_9BACL|nr:PD-(D/E)XK nuclease family protein [Alicyclobacillus macrosporangiidus]SFV04186.1 ATP-dependent helicase/nuclease subunit B [Alicyclobacillus macrosporangiidus]
MGRVVIQGGHAGTGKSTRIARSIAGALADSPFGSRLLWVVPQDASYACERLLMRYAPAAMRAEVLTVPRLAEQVNQALGVVAGKPVNMTGKRLLLADVFQESGGALQVLWREQPSIRFLDSVLEVFAEMSSHLVSLHQVEALLETAATRLAEAGMEAVTVSGPSLIGKLRDVCTLYHWFQARLSALGLYDPDELPALLAEHVARWPALAGARVFVDGFDDLPPRDTRFLLAIAEAAEETVFSVTMDPAWLSHALGGEPDEPGGAGARGTDLPPLMRLLAKLPDPEAVWAPQTLAWTVRLLKGCRERGLPIAVEPSTAPPDGPEPVRRWLEAGLFGARVPDGSEAGARSEVGAGSEGRVGAEVRARSEVREDAGVRRDAAARANGAPGREAPIVVAAAQNLRREADGVARAALRLVHESGFRYGDIAVLVPDLAEYAPLLRDAFGRHGVDAYVDDFPPLATHPLGRFILAALDSVEDNASTEAVARLLKTEFCGLRRQDADWLEAYVRRHEVSGVAAWATEAPWQFAYDARADDARAGAAQAEDAQADALRRQLAERFLPLWQGLQEERVTPGEVAEAVWGTLQRTDAKRIVAEWMVGEAGAMSPLEASLHEQAWQRVLVLLEDLADTLPAARLSRSFLFELIRTDLVHQSLSTIPAGMDQVLVTEIRRARALHVPVLFLIGAVDGVFPRRVRPQGMLQDEERLAFERLFGRPVGYTSAELQLCERAVVHTALTRGTERLFLTYPLSDEAGKAARPSRVVERVSALPAGAVDTQIWVEDALWDEPQVWTPLAALDTWVGVIEQARRTGRVPVAAVWVFDWLRGEDAVQRRLDAALAGLGFTAVARPLPARLASALYGQPLHVHVHQLEAFAACPFQHFVRYGLRVGDEDVARAARAARGNLIHDVLERFVEEHAAAPEAWRALSDDEAVERVRARFAEVLQQPRTQAWRRLATRLEAARTALGVIEKAAVVLTRHVRHGRFLPVHSELSFGDDARAGLPALEVALPGGGVVRVHGRIDRVDVAEAEGRLAFRVMDYKSNMGIALDLLKVHHGLQLQLPLYAAVVARHARVLFGTEAEPAAVLYMPVGRSPRTVRVPESGDEARVHAYRSMRPRGLLLADPELVAWMDERLPDGSETELFGKVFTKDGRFTKGAPVAGADAWRGMLRKVLGHVREVSARVAGGEIQIAPYQLSLDDHACKRCPLQSVCHLDRRWERPMRRLERRERADILADWAAGEEERR